ncbi:aldehyde dehydrogenase family protein [Phytoactinopolyspora halotolerans]|uniref:Aldehyde dehydrogenase family protein n=1 Tax=Phytoactinopolyspora halotolerans TaxID=1981512 RepID=A0A6L9S9N8_9ACTN|nr:aldehyde dehydrogenase family protein [Phytoactinopolyspora halotolerans]NEE01272.1 aldehyde dehydrogenase family protein [Phytoactinopolyspora halotolerans]
MTFLDPAAWSGKVFSDGWTPAHGGTRPVIEPATGDQLETTGLADADDLARATRAAAAAQHEWAATPHHARAAVLRRAGDLWAEHAEEITQWIVRESGSIPGKAGFELHVAQQECYEAATLPGRPWGELLAGEEPRLSMAQRLPVGVVGVIAPFNAPLILSIRSVAPALALGNAVVLKPDPRTAVCGGVALARVFAEAGLPDGLLHVLPGGADVGQALVSDPLVPVISFTGSTAAGRKVGALAGEHLKRVHLELGGNSAMVVMDDADLDLAAASAAWGSFFHQGQICMTTGRHIVHESVYGEYVDRLATKADAMPVGNPYTDDVALGPIIDETQLRKISGLVDDSVAAGARLAAGGTADRLFYRPTVLADVDRSAPAYAEEVFGPVAPVIRFSSLDEAAALAADTPYGLSLGILAGDAMRAYELAQRIPTGIVHINDQTVNDEATIPFGGVGASGTGARFGGAAANVEAFTDTRWVTMRSSISPKPF